MAIHRSAKLLYLERVTTEIGEHSLYSSNYPGQLSLVKAVA